jgi:hypothetical protein
LESSSDSVKEGERMSEKIIKSLCKTCSERCSEFYDKDTTVYECDDYKKVKPIKKLKKG